MCAVDPINPNTADWGAHALRGWRKVWLDMLHALPASPAWRRIALWLRKPLKGALPACVDATIWGLRLRIRTRGNLSEQRLLLMPQYLDSTERAALAEELSGGGVFLDIGANAGVYSLWIASLRNPAIQGHAFEPDPELCALLRRNLAENHLAQAHLHACALGRSTGAATLVSGQGNKGENRVETTGDTIAKPTGMSVPMTTLPAWLAEQKIARIDALKIDVEGHEVDVLEPLFTGTDRAAWPRLIVCEVIQDGEHALADLLDRYGYRLTERGRLNGIYRLEPSKTKKRL